ncbi:hypothetical protein LCGC14_0389510 [marine sediment metagenome]|uniref:Uncharacterized protein n=1 Tax=marine sediment metagenome TaxID=412755 RepID=A0A0F9T5R0_9ZZZZ
MAIGNPPSAAFFDKLQMVAQAAQTPEGIERLAETAAAAGLPLPGAAGVPQGVGTAIPPAAAPGAGGPAGPAPGPMDSFFQSLQGLEAPVAPQLPQLPGAAAAPRPGQGLNPQLLEQIRQLLVPQGQSPQVSALGSLVLGR